MAFCVRLTVLYVKDCLYSCIFCLDNMPSFFNADIDECAENIDSCSHDCVNTDGSYYCSCPNGSVLISDNKTCTGEVFPHIQPSSNFQS